MRPRILFATRTPASNTFEIGCIHCAMMHVSGDVPA